jgi:flagellin-like protein
MKKLISERSNDGGVLSMALMNNDNAVSPVIGTILMVAVTVILAAVIAAFVFGMPTNIQKAKLMGSSVQMEKIEGAMLLSYYGGPDDITLTMINITAPNGSVWYTSSTNGALTISTATSPAPVKPDIGATLKLNPAPDWPVGQKRVLAVASFSDGVQQVILDSYF